MKPLENLNGWQKPHLDEKTHAQIDLGSGTVTSQRFHRDFK